LENKREHPEEFVQDVSQYIDDFYNCKSEMENTVKFFFGHTLDMMLDEE
jgi:hypothetical protein